MPELLTPGTIHVWLLRRPQQPCKQWLAQVTAEERLRMTTMASPRRQLEWLAGRALLRQCLAHYTGIAGIVLPLDKTEAGKPLLALPDAPAFSLSHGPGWLGCAVARADIVGLDIDSTSRRNRTDEIAERYFHPQEQAAIRQAPDESSRKQAFFRSWTLKEAFIKARGETINSVRLHELGFTADGEPLFTLPAGQWHFQHCNLDGDHHLALACRWRECDTVANPQPHCRFRLCGPDLQVQRELDNPDRP